MIAIDHVNHNSYCSPIPGLYVGYIKSGLYLRCIYQNLLQAYPRNSNYVSHHYHYGPQKAGHVLDEILQTPKELHVFCIDNKYRK